MGDIIGSCEFDFRVADLLASMIENDVFARRGIETAGMGQPIIEKSPGEAICTARFKRGDRKCVLKITWQLAGIDQERIFAVAQSARPFKVQERETPVTLDDINGRCVAMTKISNLAAYVIEEPFEVITKKIGTLVAIAKAPSLPFSASLSYENDAVPLQALLLGLVEDALDAADMMEESFGTQLDFNVAFRANI